MDKTIMPMNIADCQYFGDAVKFSIGNEVYELKSEPAAETMTDSSYGIALKRCGNDENVPSQTLFSILFELTPEEYKAAINSSINDCSIYVHNIDGMMSIRVARDIFSYFLVSLGNTEYNDAMRGRYTEEWCDYLHYLIHERMDGRAISPLQTIN